jgi:hypothetical protein
MPKASGHRHSSPESIRGCTATFAHSWDSRQSPFPCAFMYSVPQCMCGQESSGTTFRSSGAPHRPAIREKGGSGSGARASLPSSRNHDAAAATRRSIWEPARMPFHYHAFPRNAKSRDNAQHGRDMVSNGERSTAGRRMNVSPRECSFPSPKHRCRSPGLSPGLMMRISPGLRTIEFVSVNDFNPAGETKHYAVCV